MTDHCAQVMADHCLCTLHDKSLSVHIIWQITVWWQHSINSGEQYMADHCLSREHDRWLCALHDRSPSEKVHERSLSDHNTVKQWWTVHDRPPSEQRTWQMTVCVQCMTDRHLSIVHDRSSSCKLPDDPMVVVNIKIKVKANTPGNICKIPSTFWFHTKLEENGDAKILKGKITLYTTHITVSRQICWM